MHLLDNIQIAFEQDDYKKAKKYTDDLIIPQINEPIELKLFFNKIEHIIDIIDIKKKIVLDELTLMKKSRILLKAYHY